MYVAVAADKYRTYVYVKVNIVSKTIFIMFMKVMVKDMIAKDAKKYFIQNKT